MSGKMDTSRYTEGYHFNGLISSDRETWRRETQCQRLNWKISEVRQTTAAN